MRPAKSCLFLVMLLTMGPAHASFAAEAPDSTRVATAIEQRLLLDGGVSADRIVVRADHGIVTMTGAVDTLLVQRRAPVLAKTINGVRAVVNLVDVTPWSRSGEDVQGDVNAALAANPATAGQPIQVAVIRGTVTLAGTVQSAVDQHVAELLALGVSGVQQVENSLVVSPPPQRPAWAIEVDVRQSFNWDAWLARRPVGIGIEPATVVLSGTVASPYEKRRADRLANVDGVNSVVDHLRVDPVLLRPDEAPSPARPDGEIAAAIVDAFHADPRLRKTRDDLHADVAARQATISGTVASYAAKRAARHDAKDTVGVIDVVDHTAVDPSAQPPDPVVRESVRQALLHDPEIALDDVGVDVQHGQVLLRGVVPTTPARDRATRIAAEVDGVTDVVNRLTVIRDSDSMVQAPQAPQGVAK